MSPLIQGLNYRSACDGNVERYTPEVFDNYNMTKVQLINPT